MISAAALYVAHAGSSRRCEETILVHGGGVVSGRVLRSPIRMKNRHTLDGLAVPNRQFCRAFWRQVGSHVSLLWRSQQFFSSRQPRHGLPGTRILPGCEHRLMSPTSFRNWCISREASFSIRSGRPARSAAGTVVVGLGAGCGTSLQAA